MKFAKLGAIGAVGVALGLLALYLFLCWVNRSQNLTGGIDQIQQYVAWIAMLIPTLAIVAVNLSFARILWEAAHGKRPSY